MMNEMRQVLKEMIGSEEFSSIRKDLLGMSEDKMFINSLSQKDQEELFELIKISDELNRKYNLK